MINKLFWFILLSSYTMGIYACWPEKDVRLSPPQFQQRLIDSGYPLPNYGTDGKYGTETMDAWWAYYNDGLKND